MTREELHRELHSMTWKMVSAMVAINAASAAFIYFQLQNQTTLILKMLEHWKP
jgi:hypothetical protein